MTNQMIPRNLQIKKAKLLKNCLGTDDSIIQVSLTILSDPKPKLEGENGAETSTMTDGSVLEATLY